MANYESASGIQSVINDSLAAGGLSAATAAAITELLDQLTNAGVAAKAENVSENITNADQIAAGTQVVIMDPTTSADVTFGANSDVKAMVVGGAGNSNVVFETSDNVTVQLGGGTNDSVATGGGNDTITFAGGSATIDTGAGNDTVVLQGNGAANIQQTGSGDMNIVLESDSVSATIDAGDGFDTVSLAGSIASRIFTFVGNAFHMAARAIGGRAADDGIATQADGDGITMDNVNVVTFTDAAGTPEEITVLADSAQDAVFTSLYKVVLGRFAIDQTSDQLAGINFWTTQFDESRPMDQAVASFMACDEIQAKIGNQTAEQTVQMFFDNLGAAKGTTVTQINGLTAAAYAQQVNSGVLTINDVAQQIVESAESVQILGQDGAAYFVAPDGMIG